MKKNYLKVVIQSVLISLIGVYVIDYFSHLLFSSPMETPPYFMAKTALYFVFSIIFLSFFEIGKKEFIKVVIAGIIVSSLWGFYYNILPYIMDTFFKINFYPYGVALKGLTFLGMGLFGTGLAFGIVHTLAFIGGYYSSNLILNLYNKNRPS
jgi:hypothetical protein